MKSSDKNARIGQWLKEKREEKGMSQQMAAERLGITRTAIHYWETGKRTIYAVNLIDYCKILDANPQQIVNDIMEK